MSRQNHQQHAKREGRCDRELHAEHGNIAGRKILRRGEREESPDRQQAKEERKIANRKLLFHDEIVDEVCPIAAARSFSGVASSRENSPPMRPS